MDPTTLTALRTLIDRYQASPLAYSLYAELSRTVRDEEKEAGVARPPITVRLEDRPTTGLTALLQQARAAGAPEGLLRRYSPPTVLLSPESAAALGEDVAAEAWERALSLRGLRVEPEDYRTLRLLWVVGQRTYLRLISATPHAVALVAEDAEVRSAFALVSGALIPEEVTPVGWRLLDAQRVARHAGGSPAWASPPPPPGALCCRCGSEPAAHRDGMSVSARDGAPMPCEGFLADSPDYNSGWAAQRQRTQLVVLTGEPGETPQWALLEPALYQQRLDLVRGSTAVSPEFLRGWAAARQEDLRGVGTPPALDICGVQSPTGAWCDRPEHGDTPHAAGAQVWVYRQTLASIWVPSGDGTHEPRIVTQWLAGTPPLCAACGRVTEQHPATDGTDPCAVFKAEVPR